MAGLIESLGAVATSGTDVTAAKATPTEIEQKALQDAGIFSFVASSYEKIRAGLGFDAATGGWLYAVIGGLYAVVLLVVFLAGIAVQYLWNIKPLRMALIGVILLAVLAGGAYAAYHYLYKKDDSNVIDAGVKDIKSLFGNEPFENPTPEDSLDQPLLDIQPLAMKQTGYIGPSARGGLFSPTDGVQAALKAGVRFFVLQIDFLESSKDPAKFAPKGEPTLLYRDDNGTLVSANGGDLKKVAQTLADYAFAEETIRSSLPLIIYLHFVRTPSPVKAPETYVQFLSKTAAALEPLFKFLPEGAYARQQSEASLFKTPVRTFSKRVVYLTNIDTSMFRKPDVLGMKPFEPQYDLDNLVHARVYADTAGDTLGATISTTAEKPTAAAILVSWKRLSKLGDKDADAFAQRGKNRFVIAMPGQMGNPEKSEITKALDRLGVNVLPMNLFGESANALKAKISAWKADKFLRQKPAALRATALGGVLPV